MALIGDALRQAFMPKREYDGLREEERVWGRVQKPVVTAVAAGLCLAVLTAVAVSIRIVFPANSYRRPFCRDQRVQTLRTNTTVEPDTYRYNRGAFYLTDEEAADYYWMAVFIPSTVVFCASAVYLFAGIIVAYSAPNRHGCLKVVENNYCASRRGGVRCLSILNIIFAVVFGLLALFLGSSLLTLGSGCSVPLFWCYEIAAWGLVILYGGTAFFLRRKAAVVLDGVDHASQSRVLEMLESNFEVTPEVERRLNEGFKAWMGSSLLSSDEEDEADEYIEEAQPILPSSKEQRV